ncbi:M4 family metallopeptidase [Streptomyces sp. NPDC048496]|uniref:M4 family metallopeptidase n=1 Tax=Streptomyces sp. NPDC048496 TaxID=3365558 RepID=UPI003715410E
MSTSKDGKQSSVRFQQKHDGVPVFGAEYAVQTEAADGGQSVTSATGTLYTDLSVSTTPSVSEAAAEKRMFSLDGNLSRVEGAKTEGHGLIVLPDARGGKLTWHFTVTGAEANGSPVRQEVYVDANIGGIALSYNNIDAADAAPAKGTGARVDGSSAELDINKETDGSYTLVDSTRDMYARTGGQIRTYDARRKSYSLVAGGPVTEDVPLATSASDRFDGTNTSSGAVDAHVNAAKIYEYLKDKLGRDGVDGKGGTIYSVVNVANNGKDYANAFWDGSKMVYDHMGGVPLSVGLDVVGHEMTHGVTEHSAGLVYLNQSGALNEAISDYFGNAMETADKGVAMSDPTSGLVGEYLCNGTKPLAECALRDLNDGRNAQTDYEPITLDIDNGGVHSNSTIVGGALWDMRKNIDAGLADRITYRAAQNYLTPLSGFTDMRNAVTLAAKSLKVSAADLDAIGRAAQINGDVYAIGHGDAIAWGEGSAAFGITVGRFGKKPQHELAQSDAYLMDPSLDDERVVFTRISAAGVGIYQAGDKGQGAIKKLVDSPDADETEPVTESGALAYISTTADGEQDVMLRKADGTTVNVTPEAGTKASRLAGLNNFSLASCSSGSQLAPSLGDGQRIVWLDTTAAATDVVTRGTFAGTCE